MSDDYEFEFSRMGVGRLRDVSLGDIEKAIAEALGTLAGGQFTVTVQSLQFPPNTFGGTARLAFAVSERPEKTVTGG